MAMTMTACTIVHCTMTTSKMTTCTMTTSTMTLADLSPHMSRLLQASSHLEPDKLVASQGVQHPEHDGESDEEEEEKDNVEQF